MSRSSRDPSSVAALDAIDQAMKALTVARRLVQRGSQRRGGSARAAADGELAFDRAFRDGAPVATRRLEEVSVTVRDAAAMLGIGEEQVRRRLRSGDLLGVPFGGRIGWRLSREYVERLAIERTTAEHRRAGAASAAKRQRARPPASVRRSSAKAPRNR